MTEELKKGSKGVLADESKNLKPALNEGKGIKFANKIYWRCASCKETGNTLDKPTCQHCGKPYVGRTAS